MYISFTKWFLCFHVSGIKNPIKIRNHDFCNWIIWSQVRKEKK